MERVHYGGCFALLLKVHHCAMDGATGTQFMNIVHDLSPDTRDVGKAPPWIVERMSRGRMLAKAYFDQRQYSKSVATLKTAEALATSSGSQLVAARAGGPWPWT